MERLVFWLVFFSILGGCSIASAQVFKNDDLTISKFEDNMWVVETTDNTTMYIVEGTDKAMLIDTGTKCENLDNVIRHITKKPLVVVITHAHPDHAGNIDYFDEIWLHPSDTVLLSKNYKGSVQYLYHGQVFDLGQTRLEVAHMPGHTPGSVVLLDWQTGNCYSGDAFGSGMVWLQLRPFTPIKTYAKSCMAMELLMDKGITKIYCGHYPYVKKTYSKEYITDMRKLAIMLDEGLAEDAKPFPRKIPQLGSNNPMVVTLNNVSIVYEPEHIK